MGVPDADWSRYRDELGSDDLVVRAIDMASYGNVAPDVMVRWMADSVGDFAAFTGGGA